MVVLNSGRRLEGKTTLGVYQVDKRDLRVMIDPRGLIRRPGAIVASTLTGFNRGLAALVDGDADEVVFTPVPPPHLTDEELLLFYRDEFRGFCRAVLTFITAHPDAHVGILVDEAKLYGDITKCGSFMHLVKSCDRDHVDVVITCHRPSDVKPDLRFHIDKWNLFRTTQEEDLDVVRSRATRDVVDQVQQLGPHEYVIWNDDRSTSRVHRASYTWHSELKPSGAEPHILHVH